MFFLDSRRARVCTLAAAILTLTTPAAVVAEPVQLSAAVEAGIGIRGPFGFGALLPASGKLLDKWHGVLRQWNDEKHVLVDCREHLARCTDPAALAFVTMIDRARGLTGRAQLGEVNRMINLAVRPVSDLSNYGSIDVWSSPLATLTRQSGDCEDYAIAKFLALLEAGMAQENLRLLIVRDVARAEDHAIVAARHDDHWLILDNRRLVMLTDTQLSAYAPLFLLEGESLGQKSAIAVASAEPVSRVAAIVEPSGIVD